MGSMGDVGDPPEVRTLDEVRRMVDSPLTHHAQNTGDRAELNAVIDRIRAVLREQRAREQS